MSDHADGVGSLAEEAAKLFGALSGLAREQRANLHEGLSDLSDSAAAAAREVDERLSTSGATSGDDCTHCPVCRAIHLVRETSPEFLDQVAAAASSLMQAAAGLLVTAAFTDPRPDGDDGDVDLDKGER